MTVLFIVEIICLAGLYLVSRNKYREEISILGDEKDRLKSLLPIGLKLMELLSNRLLTKYSNKYKKALEAKLRGLNGGRDVHTLLKLHLANKAALMLLSFVFLTFVGTQIELDPEYAFFSLMLLAVMFYVTDKQLDDRAKERKRNMQLEFPEFLNKLILLVNAGLTVPGAIRKIVKDNKKTNPLYTELGMAINEMNSGKPEVQAYEDFAKRCRLQEVTMFVTVLLQNLRKGNDELIPVLRLEANICWENRKNIARKLGEEAAAKLLIPMVIIFIAILLMIMTPAVMQLNF